MGKIDQSVADKIIVNLSSILRYSISNMEEDVTVRQDMAITQSYLSILKTRFNKRFTYSLQINEDILACTIPKLLIQPLIENAVKHGFGDQEILNMNIKGYRDGDCLIFVCQDDGAGINADTLRDLQFTLTRPQNPGEHLGIYNIHKRINLKYKGNYGISIDSKAGEGTTLTIALPAKAKDRERDMEDA